MRKIRYLSKPRKFDFKPHNANTKRIKGQYACMNNITLLPKFEYFKSTYPNLHHSGSIHSILKQKVLHHPDIVD